MKTFLYTIPMIAFCLLVQYMIDNVLLILLISGMLCSVYYFYILCFIEKDEYVRKYAKRIYSFK